VSFATWPEYVAHAALIGSGYRRHNRGDWRKKRAAIDKSRDDPGLAELPRRNPTTLDRAAEGDESTPPDASRAFFDDAGGKGHELFGETLPGSPSIP